MAIAQADRHMQSKLQFAFIFQRPGDQEEEWNTSISIEVFKAFDNRTAKK